MFVCPFSQRKIAQAAGFRFDRDLKNWITYDKLKAAKLARYAAEDLRAELTGYSAEKLASIDASRSIGADIRLPVPYGLKYYPFQAAGIAYGMSRDNVLFADEMGLGKTIQALGLVNVWQPTTVLVITTLSSKLTWVKEASKWLTVPYSIRALKSHEAQPVADRFVIINYDNLHKCKWLLKVKWGVVIGDEVHKVKSGKRTKRGDAFYRIAANALKRIFITGTPMLHRPIDLYHIADALGMDMPRMDYARRYCAATSSWDIKGASNLAELQRMLRASFMVRRLKIDVQKDLPLKVREIIAIDPEEAAAGAEIAAEAERQQFWQDQMQKFREQRDTAEKGTDAYNNAIAGLQKAGQAEWNELAILRKETAIKKIPFTIAHVSELLQTGEVDKVIVFGWHREAIFAIREGLDRYGVVGIVGGDKDTQRQAAITEFQEGAARVFVGSIGACAEAITLTAADVVVFIEMDWSPEINKQAEDRAHRIGQESTVIVQYIVIDGSIDQKIAQSVKDKAKVINEALD